ncbi:hypothetical protein J7E50_20245 [Pedobacter sp. ISL-68]|uniref:hypothetical protein n=1 Tax=unclassified Pedobacter TaxID=2628915 RepID=UPI001BE537A1|nr:MULTISPECIES: hypothetical protein [unclassified Pedobacter]MBT2564034.1 hypothetical protein [Pedobacter sp. ISL-64]MBT2592559.1 hypothetical protein [Pedobacter sp. ISL-68]
MIEIININTNGFIIWSAVAVKRRSGSVLPFYSANEELAPRPLPSGLWGWACIQKLNYLNCLMVEITIESYR